MEDKDKITITITLERDVNGCVHRAHSITGAGFHYFEVIGLLQMTCYEMAQKSIETAKELPKDKPVRIEFKSNKEE